MIPKQEDVVVYSNASNEKAFTINASREAFRILSSGIYSNKIQAIIRELSCNALDSHTSAGCPDRPFRIHLPDAWEPYLEIEDYGVGLDDDAVNKVLTVYFMSDKNHSNDLIGGKGLGSKSPFSYTGTFTVRARKDGVERVYSAYISDNGNPATSLMSEVDTDEPNGVMVTVPVRNTDFHDFKREADNVYQWFRVPPDGWNGSNDSVQELDNNNGFVIRSSNYNSGNVTVVMGSVAYYVKITESEIPLTYTRAWSFLKKSSLTIRFDIGELETTASRETIDFDEETKEIFVKRIENIIDEYYAKFQEVLNTQETIFDALKYAEDNIGEWSWQILEYRGQPLFTFANVNTLEHLMAILDPENKTVEFGEIRLLTRGSGNQISTNVIKDKYGTYKISYKNFKKHKLHFFMDDTEHGRGFDQTGRTWLRMHYHTYVVMLPFVLSDEQMKQIEEMYGEENLGDIVKLSEIKESLRVVREKERINRPRKTPVARAKKNEIRIDCWENNDPTGIGFHTRRLIDIDEISDLRVGIFVSSRGESEFAILGTVFSTLNNTAYVFLSKLFELDYIMVIRPSQYESIKQKMPFAVNIHELERKDIKNNEVGFLFTCLSIWGYTLHNLSKSLTDYSIDLDNIIFTRYYKYLSNVRKIASCLKILDYPEKTFASMASELRDKLTDTLNFFTDEEIKQVNDACDFNSKAWSWIYDQYTASIAESLYKKYYFVTRKYPMLMDLLYAFNGINNQSLCDNFNDYIKMRHEKYPDFELPADILINIEEDIEVY